MMMIMIFDNIFGFSLYQKDRTMSLIIQKSCALIFVPSFPQNDKQNEEEILFFPYFIQV
jgi:hypothetical protein